MTPQLVVEPIQGSTFGVEIHDLDLNHDLQEPVLKKITTLLHEHRLVIIKDQHLSEARYIDFGREMGRPDPHPLDHLRMPGFPEIEQVTNTEEKDRDAVVRNSAAFWHTDQAYESEPASVIMIYAIKVPRRGGETMIADMRAAYDDLDEQSKRRLDGLVAQHAYGRGEVQGKRIKTEEQRKRLPPVRHYLAPPHPATGRKSLYAVSGFAYGVEGLSPRRARELLDELKEHALSQRYLYRREHVVGDITVLDTRQTLHHGPRLEFGSNESNSRMLWRIATKGPPRVCEDFWHPFEP